MNIPRSDAAVCEALQTWRADHPDAVPGFAAFDPERPNEYVLIDQRYDPILARLIWLEWWMGWTLAHCDRPAIYNY